MINHIGRRTPKRPIKAIDLQKVKQIMKKKRVNKKTATPKSGDKSEVTKANEQQENDTKS